MLARRETTYIRMPNKTIHYYSKFVYGKELFYFVNTEDELLFQTLTGRKTMRSIDIVTLRQWNIILKLEFNKGPLEAASTF